MLNPTSNPLTFLMAHPNFLLHPRHMDNHSHPILHTHNPIPDFLTWVGPHSPSFNPHFNPRFNPLILIPSAYIFSLTHPTKVPGPSTNCLCCPTHNPTLYLRDQ